MKTQMMKASVTALFTLMSAQAFAAQEVTVYTAFETDLLAKFKTAFEKDNPDININWVRDSTGIMTAKLLAEKSNPRAEVVWGLAGSSLALLKEEGIIKPYSPKGVEQLREQLIDGEHDPAWFGNLAVFNAICYNEIVGKQLNLPKPTSWEDLTDPVYKGHIAMPNPASSGTGYMQVSGWISSFGEAGAWSYMDKLNSNIAHYTHSGSKPCVQAAMGEVAIGISMATRAAKLKNQGAPLDIIVPKGIGWDVDAVGLVKASEASQRIVDWAVSKSANELYVQAYPVVGHKDVKAKVPNYPEVEKSMAKMDFTKMGIERVSVLAAWSEKFDSKSEPKS
ncbi:putative 2-aminoethylphosphonate ABC transporter substrate-binding protein [Enterovibrio sp. ZSDZ35]|uniref:2-aminoethylphosphonate ABC transporter substrate-binding protein n=1 Tax=Enterovibrio qingdaonensis TaxID=2899818 RepID=A0ABT5QHN1_9GAMM|nr:putative 2-aminoethylphosphonate ABC transporter substrate-binding protein [Enterovibrio sp. ZSDZ35]MDD1780490.1 putative 2-aminoethylphosphonate ABC transporter substrate-binding protein [Enterovibrio sp. ZSDZ35]